MPSVTENSYTAPGPTDTGKTILASWVRCHGTSAPLASAITKSAYGSLSAEISIISVRGRSRVFVTTIRASVSAQQTEADATTAHAAKNILKQVMVIIFGLWHIFHKISFPSPTISAVIVHICLQNSPRLIVFLSDKNAKNARCQCFCVYLQ